MSSARMELAEQIQVRHTSPQVVGIPLDREQTLLLLSNKLLPLLPYSITLTRRIQFDLRQPSSTAQVYLTVVPPSPISDHSQVSSAITEWLTTSSTSQLQLSQPFLANYVDLIPAGQTQVFTFASWEIPFEHTPPFSANTTPSPPPNPILSASTAPPPQPVHSLLLQTLLTHLIKHLIPLRPTSPPPDWLWLRDNKKYLSQPYSVNKVLFGALHASLVPLVSLQGTTRRDGRYWKLIFPPPPSPSSASSDATADANANSAPASSATIPSLPQGYKIGTLTDAELQTVLDRSPIPRTIGTLRSLVNVGIYYDHSSSENHQNSPAQPAECACVGWGFLSKDGSISSVHVEEPHRGRGLAVYLTSQLLARLPEAFAVSFSSEHHDQEPQRQQQQQQQQWGHVDVEENNIASQRAMRKLGAEVWFGVQWVEIDVGRVLEELEGGAGGSP